MLKKDSLNLFEDSIREKAGIQAHNARVPVQDIFKKNLCFIGVTFRNHASLRGNSSTPFDPYFTRFRRVHLSICEHIIGPRFARRTHLQPLTYAFIDDAGTRHKQRIRAPFSNLHIHAVMLLPQWSGLQRLKFNALVKDRGFIWSLRDFNIDSFHVELYDPAKGTVRDSISYAAKGYLNNSELESRYGNMWQSYPEPRHTRAVKVANPFILRQGGVGSPIIHR